MLWGLYHDERGVILKKVNTKYHPKMLAIFTQEELDCLEKESDYSINKDGYIDVMIVNTDKIMVEIFIDCEAKKKEYAIIALLDDCGYNYPNQLTKDEFWKVYLDSKVAKIHCTMTDEE